MARALTGKKNFTKYQQVTADNGKQQREVIMKYVQERKSGQRKS